MVLCKNFKVKKIFKIKKKKVFKSKKNITKWEKKIQKKNGLKKEKNWCQNWCWYRCWCSSYKKGSTKNGKRNFQTYEKGNRKSDCYSICKSYKYSLPRTASKNESIVWFFYPLYCSR